MKPEDAQRDRKALEIFGRAVELPGAEARAAYLEGACGGEAALKARVEALMANHVEDNFLQRPAADLGPGATAIVPVTEQPGDRIGRYKLLQRIGVGGMGVVYMAEQEERVRRQVALKIIKLGMDTRSVVARFEAERQALALMDHPNIAKVLDAGTTETGRPYFVMELVRGVPITNYCDKNHLGTGARLDLFIQVCHAIQHAHQKGIIHRDIKPSNVMVTLHDGVPVPKVIDFGVAKATGQRLTEKTLFTHYATMVGTPACMSPEQAEMSGLDIDTRTDVYALGVLLYELLTGTTPFPAAELLSKGYGEMRRILAEVEPARPSTRLSTMQNEERTVVARNRGTDESALGRGFQGDLHWIVMKCLEKDRTRRYETASALVADLKRHLGNEPVVARPPSAAYRFQKLVRRNKLAFAAAGAVMAAVLVGLAVALVGLRQESKARLPGRRGKQLCPGGPVVRAPASAPRGEEDLRGFEWRLLGHLSRDSSLHIFADSDSTGRPDKSSDTAVAFSPAEPRLAIARENGTVRFWNPVTRQPLGETFKAHGGQIRCLAFSPDGKLLATGSGGLFVYSPCTIRLWDVTSQQMLMEKTQAHALGIESLSFSPDGKTLAVSHGLDRMVRLWDISTQQEMSPLPAAGTVDRVVFTPDGRHLVSADGGGWIHVWETATWQQVRAWKDNKFITAMDLSPDGKTLATVRLTESIKLWDLATGRQVGALPGHRDVVGSLAFSPDGRTLVSSSMDGVVKFWSVTARQEIINLRAHKNAAFVAFSPDANTLATASLDKTVRLWRATAAESDAARPAPSGASTRR